VRESAVHNFRPSASVHSSALRMICCVVFCLIFWTVLLGLSHDGVFAQTSSASPSDSLPTNMPPQSTTPTPAPGTLTGTVADKDGAVIANATLLLKTGSFTARAQTGGDGTFVFTNVPSGPFELSISAPGFATQKQTATLQPGENAALPPIQLVVATSVEVNVTQTREEIAQQQVRVEEEQRVFGVIPNFYVTYEPDPQPLNTRQKFQLGWRSVIDPVSFGIAGVIAGVEQANDSYSGYGQGAQGYAKRFGATYADFVSGTFFGSVILPAILKQDPRYFYKGTGTRKARFFHAVASSVICRGDNGRWQPNYSNMLGDLAAGGLSNLYYPASDRNGVGLTFQNAAIGIGGSAMGAVIEEFFLHKVTSHSSAASSPN